AAPKAAGERAASLWGGDRIREREVTGEHCPGDAGQIAGVAIEVLGELPSAQPAHADMREGVAADLMSTPRERGVAVRCEKRAFGLVAAGEPAGGVERAARIMRLEDAGAVDQRAVGHVIERKRKDRP